MTEPLVHGDSEADESVAVIDIGGSPWATSDAVRRTTNQIDKASRNPDIRAIVLQSTGASLWAGFPPAMTDRRVADPEVAERHLAASRLLLAIHEAPVIVIAGAHGTVRGVGLAVAMASDLLVLSSDSTLDAHLGMAFLELGDLGLAWLSHRRLGSSKASRLLLTGPLRADCPVLEGMSELVDGDVHARAIALARRVADQPRNALEMSKRCWWRNQEITSFAAAVELDNRGQAVLAASVGFRSV